MPTNELVTIDITEQDEEDIIDYLAGRIPFVAEEVAA